MKTPPKTCPNCGADVPRDAKACPECGSDEQTGWSEEAAAAELGLPDNSFDYSKFVREELEGHQHTRNGAKWYWCAIAAITVLVLVAMLITW